MTKTPQKRAMTEVVWLQSINIVEYDKASAQVTSDRIYSKIITYHKLLIFISCLKINYTDPLRVTHTETSIH